jgi:choline-sulfatase
VKGDAPWCAFVSFVEPHDPFITQREYFEYYMGQELPEAPNAHDDLADRPGLYRRAQRIWRQVSPEQKREARACYYGSITEIDAQFGRILNWLRESGAEENTIVVMTADHGDLLGAHGLFFKDISAFEEIYRVPFLVAGPGVAQGTTCTARVGLHDLCPTLLEVAGCESFGYPDSRSFAALLSAPDAVGEEWTRGYAEYFGNRHRLTQRVVWDGPWKFVFNGFDFDELYHLDDDPWEMHNLADDPAHADTLRRMTQLYWQYARTTGDTPLAETLYPALRLGTVGPLSGPGAPKFEASDRDYRR